MTWQTTVENPDVLLEPWVMDLRTLTLNRDPMATLLEGTSCRDRDVDNLVTREHH